MKHNFKHIYMVLKIATFPLWLPIWLLGKTWRLFTALFLIALISGCASSSNTFDKSPCACEFVPLNAAPLLQEGLSHA